MNTELLNVHYVTFWKANNKNKKQYSVLAAFLL